MSIKMLGVNVFQVDTVQQHELGQEAEDVKGGEGILSFSDFLPVQSATGGLAKSTTNRFYDPHGIYRYVRAGTGGLAVGVAAGIETGATEARMPHQLINMTAEGVIHGVPIIAIPAASFGWVQIHGKHYNLAVADAVADDVALEPGAGPALIAATLDIAHYAATHGSIAIRKICDQTALFTEFGLTGTADRGVGFIRW